MQLERALFQFVFRIAVLGSAALLLTGLLLPALGVILGMALVGFLMWMPLHSLFYGRRRQIRHDLSRAKAYCRQAARNLRPLTVGMDQQLSQTWQQARTLSARLWTFLVEIFSGAVVGGLFALLRGPEVEAGHIVLGGLIGAALGTVVALSRLQSPAEASHHPG
jgi:hypothetical protein